jgi:hypothetical protein
MVFDLPKLGLELTIQPIRASFPHATSAVSDDQGRVQDRTLPRKGKLAA